MLSPLILQRSNPPRKFCDPIPFLSRAHGSEGWSSHLLVRCGDAQPHGMRPSSPWGRETRLQQERGRHRMGLFISCEINDQSLIHPGETPRRPKVMP